MARYLVKRAKNRVLLLIFILNLSRCFGQYPTQKSTLESISNKTAVIFMANRFEELQLTTTNEILCAAGINTYVITLKDTLEYEVGMNDIMIKPNILIKSIMTRVTPDIVILIGGDGYALMQEHPQVHTILKTQRRNHGFIGAIGHGIAVLHTYGIGLLSAIARPPEEMVQVLGASYKLQMKKDVVFDEGLITCSNTGSVIEFSFKIVELLLGNESVKTVYKFFKENDMAKFVPINEIIA